MPVTFGTVRVVAPSRQRGGTTTDGGAEGPAQPPPPTPRPRELVPVLRQLRDRAARVRAH
jgi:hypothetical protein